jgi:GR25 family glycosyltransferase involved in LPS biosynthesis
MFDAIIYINLKHRTDRNRDILEQIKKINMTVPIHRINAVLEPMCGHIGCGKSHILALELAIKNNYSSVLILEDDFIFTEDYDENSFSKIKNIEWDVILLAKGFCNIVETEYPFLKRIVRATTTSGYIVKQHYYNILLENFTQSVIKMEQEFKKHSEKCISNNLPVTKLHICSAIDQYWQSLQRKDIFYIYEPPIGKQSNSWSDNNYPIEYQKKYLVV